MKVAWVSHSAGMLGAERVMMEGVGQLAAAGIDCHLALPVGQPVAAPWDGLGASQSILPVPWWMAGRSTLTLRHRIGIARQNARAVRPMHRWIGQVAPDVVITNSLVTPVAATAAALHGIPHVWYVHEFGERDHGLDFAFGASRSLGAVNRLSRRIIVNSQAVADHFAAHFSPGKTDLLYCAVAAPDPGPRNRPLGAVLKLVMVAGVSPQKRQEDAVRAMAILRDRGQAAQLRIVGPSHRDYLEYLQRLAAELNVSDIITFAGSSTDPFGEYRSADLALTCARDEAFGRVSVEAMKSGTPVIGARSGGTVEIVRPGFNGLLYEPCNPQDLAERIIEACSDPAALARMGENARTSATATYNLGTYGRQLSAILEKAVSR